MLHAAIQHKPRLGRHRRTQCPRLASCRGRRRERGGPQREPPLRHPHLNATLSTASLILSTITPASSVPCLPLRQHHKGRTRRQASCCAQVPRCPTLYGG